MNKHAPIQRLSLHEQLVHRLRDMIVEGHLKPGEKISEIALTKSFGVSRTPLREALKVLTSEGMIAHTVNRGFVVATVTEEEIGEVFPLIAALEALAGELACEHITPAELAEIADLHARMLASFDADNLHDYFACNQAIHDRILVASRNHTLIQTHRNLAGRVRRARYTANLSRDRWQKAVKEHEEILEALTARRGSKLGPLLKNHLLRKMNAIIERMRDTGSVAPV